VRWSPENTDQLRTAEPNMPDGLNDRAADSWEPMVAIADLIGGGWPIRARAVAVALSGDDLAAAKDDNMDTMLLSDIRDAFTSRGTDKLSSETHRQRLCGMHCGGDNRASATILLFGCRSCSWAGHFFPD
jgi:Protein of unknown function (DUF3631)